MGPAFEDVDEIRRRQTTSRSIVRFERPSPFVLEALDVADRRTRVGAGRHRTVRRRRSERRRSRLTRERRTTTLGKPAIDRIVSSRIRSVRAAWADLLRGESTCCTKSASTRSTRSSRRRRSRCSRYTRHYAVHGRPEHRKPPCSATDGPPRAERCDRPRRWSSRRAERPRRAGRRAGLAATTGLTTPTLPTFEFDPPRRSARRGAPAAPVDAALSGDPSHERLALVLQRQLQAVGVDLTLEAVPRSIRSFERAAKPATSTRCWPTRSADRRCCGPYLFWHSNGAVQLRAASAARAVDAALDGIRHAPTTRRTSRRWRRSSRRSSTIRRRSSSPGASARARSARASMCRAEPGRDILSTLRLWQPATDGPRASRN